MDAATRAKVQNLEQALLDVCKQAHDVPSCIIALEGSLVRLLHAASHSDAHFLDGIEMVKRHLSRVVREYDGPAYLGRG